MIETKPITAKNQWEQFVDHVAPNALFQRWDWGVVQEKSGVTVLRFGFYNRHILVGVAQMFVVKAKRGNFLHVRHGPVIKNWDSNTTSKIIRQCKSIAKQYHCVCLRISPTIVSKQSILRAFGILGGLPAAIHAMDGEHAWALDVTPDEQTLLQQMRKTTRYEIRKAQKMGVQIEKTTDIASIQNFLSLYRETSSRHGFIEHKGLEEEFAVYAALGKALMISGIFEGKRIASAIILFSGGQAIYHHGASISSSVPASYLVQWEAIIETKKRNIPLYNFWGIAPEGNTHHPWRGLTLFKVGFGGQVVDMMHAYDFPVSIWYWMFRCVEVLRKTIKGY